MLPLCRRSDCSTFSSFFFFFYPACDRKSAEKREKNKENGVSVCVSFKCQKRRTWQKKWPATTTTTKIRWFILIRDQWALKCGMSCLVFKEREKRDFFSLVEQDPCVCRQSIFRRSTSTKFPLFLSRWTAHVYYVCCLIPVHVKSVSPLHHLFFFFFFFFF